MSGLFSLTLDIVLIGLLVAGIIYASRLLRQLSALRASRADMEHFVADFSGTVMRAESSIKGLKQAARSSGDDLEQLIEKAERIMDELQFMTESADQTADKLGQSASLATAAKDSSPLKPSLPQEEKVKTLQPVSVSSVPAVKTASAAERDLLQALEKMG
jgi:hypothetical protein